MIATQSSSVIIPDALAHLYDEMAISPVHLLKNYAITHIHASIQKFEVENRLFQQKYACSFNEFKAKIGMMENEEHFEWEDDFMDWEFVIENRSYWQKRLHEVEAQ